MSSAAEVVTARKWGHSVGVALPPGVVKKLKIMPDDKLVISVKKVQSMASLFGAFKTKKSAQELKDEARKGWQ